MSSSRARASNWSQRMTTSPPAAAADDAAPLLPCARADGRMYICSFIIACGGCTSYIALNASRTTRQRMTMQWVGNMYARYLQQMEEELVVVSVEGYVMPEPLHVEHVSL